MSIPSGTLLQRYSNKRKQTNYLDIIFHRLTLNNAPLSMTAPVAFVRQKKGHPPIFPIILHSFSYLSLICLLSVSYLKTLKSFIHRHFTLQK